MSIKDSKHYSLNLKPDATPLVLDWVDVMMDII